MIRITVRNKDAIDDIIAQVERDVADFKNQLLNLDNEVLEFMRDYIDSRKKRADKITSTTGKLEEVLDVDLKYDSDDKFGWSIGDEDKLNKEAKHWRALNFGSDHITRTGNKAHRVAGEFPSGPPKSGASGEAFINIRGSWLLIPQKPIVGIDYIENTKTMLLNRIIEIGNRFTNSK